MDFIKSLHESLNNILGDNQMTGGDMNGGASIYTWLIVIVVLVAVGAYLYLNEYLMCTSGRVSIDKKCVNMCPEGYSFLNVNTGNNTMVDCTDLTLGGTKVFKIPQPQPKVTPTNTPSTGTKSA
jgi:hypothetical protein